MSAEGLAGALVTPIAEALAAIVRSHGEARAREEAARVAAMLAEPLATPRPIDEVIAEARGVRAAGAFGPQRVPFVEALAARGVDVVVDPSMPPSEWRIDTRRVSEERAATEARVSPADLDVMRRMLRGPYLTTEERASVLRVAHWMGARLAIPLPPVLASEGEP